MQFILSWSDHQPLLTSCDNGDDTDTWAEQHLDQQLEQEPGELVRYIVTYNPSAPSKSVALSDSQLEVLHIL